MQEVTTTCCMQPTKQWSMHGLFKSANTCMQPNTVSAQPGSTDACNQTTLVACIWPGQMQPGCLELAWLGWEGYQTRPKWSGHAGSWQRELGRDGRRRPARSQQLQYRLLSTTTTKYSTDFVNRVRVLASFSGFGYLSTSYHFQSRPASKVPFPFSLPNLGTTIWSWTLLLSSTPLMTWWVAVQIFVGSTSLLPR